MARTNESIVFHTGGPNPYAPGRQYIELLQTGRDRFAVRYGAMKRSGLSYEQAAAELGACIMHNCACAGLIKSDSEDN